ncbi:30S ribosomal protein S13 [Patescibacteria group bacterium]|nr:30S ribosomal protein S13 [Patescibacteria group bacterium]
MARIAGVNIPSEKRIEVALTYIYGIGLVRAKKLIKDASLDPNMRARELSDADINKLRSIIEKSYKIEGDLRQQKLLNIKRLREIGSYRGLRHAKNLPVRGQRTKTNSRTVRGNIRRTAGSGRKPAAQKT